LKGAAAFGQSVLLAVEAGVAGDRVSSLVEVPKDSCAVFIARGSSSVEDLDLLAYGEDGTPLGTDEAPDRSPALLVCPPHPGRVFVTARIAQGHGIVALGGEQVLPKDARQAAARYSVKPREPGDPARLKAWPGLDELIVRERSRIGGRFEDLRRVALALDASAPTTLPASIDAGRCVHALFIPSEDVSHLDVAAIDDQGRVLGRAAGSGRQRTIVVCSPVTTQVAFEVRPHAGRGLAVAALSRSVVGSEPDITADSVRYHVYPAADAQAELTSLDERLKKLGYEPNRPVARAQLSVGRRTSTKLTLSSGCTRIDVVGSVPLRGLQARLWASDGALWAEATGGGSAVLYGCGGGGTLRLDSTALLRPGPMAVVVHRERDVPPELLRYPLAAGRLLTRMFSRGVLRRADAIGKVTELSLTAEQLTRLPQLVPLDRCLDVNVAVEGPAPGVDLRAVDVDSEQELDAASGAASASVRLCAYGRGARGSLNVRIELRTTSSTAQALFATRLLAPAE